MYHGIARSTCGDYRTAVDLFSSVIHKADARASTKAHTQRHLGNTLASIGSISEALRHYSEATAYFESTSRDDLVASLQGNIGAMFLQSEMYREAMPYFQRALRYYGSKNDSQGTARMLCNLGFAKCMWSSLSSGIPLMFRALNISAKHNQTSTLATTYLMLLQILQSKQQLFWHAYLLNKSRRSCDIHPPQRFEWYNFLVEHLLSGGHFALARTVCRQAMVADTGEYRHEQWLNLLYQASIGLRDYEYAANIHAASKELTHQHRSESPALVGRTLASLQVQRMKHEQKREQLRANQLERALQQKKEMVSFVSHDLKTPLTSVLLSVELLQKYYSDSLPPKAFDIVQRIEVNCKRQQLLIENLLGYEQVRDDVIGMERDKVNLFTLLERLQFEVSSLVQHKHQSLKLLCTNAVSVATNELMFFQILQNILVNAITYTQKGGSITIEYTQLNSVLCISDNGPGIQKTRAKQSDLMSSHGLGSSIVELFCKRLQIGLEIHSSEDGTRVALDLSRISQTTQRSEHTYGKALPPLS